MSTTSSLAQVWTYTGVWTNWSQGQVLGLTLTLSQSNATILQNFLAILVTFTGGRFWVLLTYLLHLIYSATNKDRYDGLHWQTQVLLRNTGGPASAAWEFSRLGVLWRHRAVRPIWRCLVPASLGFVTWVGFTAASILTSTVTTASGNETLVQSSMCGYNLGSVSSIGNPVINVVPFAKKEISSQLQAANYVRQCYTNQTDPSVCRAFIQPRLLWTTNTNATCPFASNLCKEGNTAAISFDTGLLSSHDAFGVNAANNNRITYRRVTTCAPIDLGSHCVQQNETGFISKANQTTTTCFAGPVNGNKVRSTNYTIKVINNIAEYNVGYQLQSFGGFDHENTSWVPIKPLNRTDADVSIFFLSQATVHNLYPVDDPWFAAHMELTSYAEGAKTPFYLADSVISPLACTDQHQLCNPTPSNGSSQLCTPLTGSEEISLSINNSLLGFNAIQNATATRFIYIALTLMYEAASYRGGSALLASETLNFLEQPAPIPNYQWQNETSSWFALGLARLQQSILEYATGPTVLSNAPNFFIPAVTAEDQHNCGNQIVRSANGYQNLRVLGVALTITLAGLVCLLSFIIEPLSRYFGDRSTPGQQQWLWEHKLQLLRLAYAEAGHDEFQTRNYTSVPTTSKGVEFPDITLLDPAIEDQSRRDRNLPTWMNGVNDKALLSDESSMIR